MESSWLVDFHTVGNHLRITIFAYSTESQVFSLEAMLGGFNGSIFAMLSGMEEQTLPIEELTNAPTLTRSVLGLRFWYEQYLQQRQPSAARTLTLCSTNLGRAFSILT